MSKNGWFFIFVLLETSAGIMSGCTPRKSTPTVESDVNTVAAQSNQGYTMLLPLNFKNDVHSACFYEVSWTKKNGQFIQQKAERINRKSLSLNSLVETAEAAAGFTATAGLTTSVIATTFCLAGTAGLGSPACFLIGGALIGAAGGAGVAAAINTQKWQKTFSTQKAEWVDLRSLRELMVTLKRKGESGVESCPQWTEFPEATRRSAWKTITKLL